MVVDPSALIHVLFREPGSEASIAFLAAQSDLLLAAPGLLEAEIVYGSKQGFGRGDVLELCDRLGVVVVPLTDEHAREAKSAYARFGKGQGHPARLNYGDCISYALAVTEGLPLVYTGDDFGHTDLESVRLPPA